MQKKLIAGGIVIGILNLTFYLLVSPMLYGKSTGIAIGGALGTSLAWLEYSMSGSNKIFIGIPPVMWFLVPGIIIGAFLCSILSKKSAWRSFRKTKLERGHALKAGIGGFLVGFGVLLANGCLIKHGLSGLPGLSLESLATLIGIVMGMWLILKITRKNKSK